MERKNGEEYNLIMAGTGGRGVLAVGRILVEAAIKQYPHIVWLPTHTTAMRGDPVECTIILSNKPIASINVWRPDTLMIIDSSMLKSFEKRVLPGGLIITEQAGMVEKVEREDVKVFEIPALQMAFKMGNPMVANLIMLGTYARISQVISPKYIENQLEQKYGGREEVLNANIEAFRAGIRLGEELNNA